MRHLAVKNFEETICENLLEVDYGSFKDIHDKNEARFIEFDYYRSSDNHFIYQLITCENYILYDYEKFIIKQISPKITDGKAYVSITAYHVIYEFQNHYIEPIENNKNDNSSDTEEPKIKYTLEQAVKKVFENQKQTLKFQYKIIGSFKQSYPLEDIFGQNGIEATKILAERFNCIVYPEKTLIIFYDEDSFYKRSEEIIRYKYNTNSITASVNTLELRTAVKVYGKKGTSDENPVVTTYISPNSKLYGIKYAAPINNEEISDPEELKEWAKSQIQDTPKTELEVNYISNNKLTPRDKVFFIHETMGYNTELKVVRLERGHFYIKSIDVVSFSNAVKDMVQIQRALNRRMKKQDNQFNYQTQIINKLKSDSKLSPFTTRTVGSVIDVQE